MDSRLATSAIIGLAIALFGCSGSTPSSATKPSLTTANSQGATDIGSDGAHQVGQDSARKLGEPNPQFTLVEQMTYEDTVRRWPAYGCSPLTDRLLPVWVVEMQGAFSLAFTPGSGGTGTTNQMHLVMRAANGQIVSTTLSAAGASAASPFVPCWDATPTARPALM